jgi:hypothetical protein
MIAFPPAFARLATAKWSGWWSVCLPALLPKSITARALIFVGNCGVAVFVDG